LYHVTPNLITTINFKTYKPASLTEIGAIPAIYYYHPDHLGTNTFLTDITGKPYQYFVNLPYGEAMAEQSSTGYYQSPYKFNGKELDKETGLYYYGARYYDPRISVWLGVDPLAEKTPNQSPYTYCSNNPINRLDPDGMNDDEWDLVMKSGGSSTLTKVNDKGGNRTQYVNLKWQTKGGDTWDLGSKTYENWPNTADARADIKSNGQAALGPWNPNWYAKASGRIDYSPIDPITDILLGGIAAKWAIGGAKAAITSETRTLGNSFKNFTLSQVDEAFQVQVKSGKLELKFVNPKTGAKAYQNTKSGYSYNLDPGGMYGNKLELPHIDVNYSNPKPLNIAPKKKLTVAGGF